MNTRTCNSWRSTVSTTRKVTGDDGVRLDREELPPGRPGPLRVIDPAAGPLNAHSASTHPGWRAVGNGFSLPEPGSAPVPMLADDDVQQFGGLGPVGADGFQLG
jgi:hypothetical protein